MSKLFKNIFLLMFIGVLFSCTSEKKSKLVDTNLPNIVLIVADDLGIGSLSCYNKNLAVPTPNIDRLASKGWKLNQFYATSPVCSPSRISMLTGLTPQQAGVEVVLKAAKEDEQEAELSKQITITTILKKAGYQTACIGKWHLGYSDKDHPTKNGFDYFAGFLNGHIDYISHTDPNGTFHLEKEKKEWGAKQGKHLTEIFTDEAIAQVKKMSGNPYFLMVSYANPHAPILLPGEDAIFQGEHGTLNDTPERYQKLVGLLDDEVGRLISAIEKENDNTLIIFLSDQGAPKILGGNYPYAGGKGNLLEGGIKIPGIFYWPGKLSPQSINKFFTSLDLFPTLLSVAQISNFKQSEKITGESVLSKDKKENEKVFYWEFRSALAVRKGNWKALFFPLEDGNKKILKRYTDATPAIPYEEWTNDKKKSYSVWLFNLKNDSTEQINLAESNIEKINELWLAHQQQIKIQNK